MSQKKVNVKMRKECLILVIVLAALTAMAVGDVQEGVNPSKGGVEAVQAPQDVNANQAAVQEAAVEQPSDNAVGNSEISEEEIAKAKALAGAQVQTLMFEKDANIKKALRVLAIRYNKNIIPSSKVDGIVTFTNLYDVTFEEALNALLGSNFKYDMEGSLVHVYTREEYNKYKEDKDRMLYKVITLYYITADEAKKLLGSVTSPKGIMSTSSETEKKISTDETGVGSETGGNSMAQNDRIVLYDYPENIAQAEKILASVDIRPQQVLIEATILSADLTEGMEFGIDWNLLNGVGLNGQAATQDYATGDTVDRGTAATTPIQQIGSGGMPGTPMETTGFAKNGLNGLRIGVTAGDLVGFITALEKVTDITVMANPKILALNKQQGTVYIGKRLGYRDQTTISDTGQATVGNVAFLDTGTKLSFRPYVGNDGYIRMDIYPKDSVGEIDSAGIPQETTAQLNTNIMVKDGQMIVIGGLFRDAITSSRSQVPILGDLPFVGVLFRGTSDSTKRQEVIVILKPHIISEPQQTMGDLRAEDIDIKRNSAKQGLQWITRTRLTEDRYANAVKFYKQGSKEAALKEVNSALELRPTYLEALRLKERIISEITPGESQNFERIMMEAIDNEAAPNWRRY